MYKFLLLLTLLYSAKSEEGRAHRYVDPFAALDRHISHTLAQHYLWPWSELFRAAAALDAERVLEEPQIIYEPDRFEVNLNVKRFKPDELRIKVKNKNIIVEGKHKEKSEDKRFMANHFVQRFVLPTGSKPEEVTAVLKPNGVLTISAPRYELPPPPPEREVPIQVIKPEGKDKESDKDKEKESNKDKEKEIIKEKEKASNTDKEKKTDNRVEKQKPTYTKEVSNPTSTADPAEQLDVVEATTHVGKIRKKELKTATKASKVNEVTKGGEDNGLDDLQAEVDE